MNDLGDLKELVSVVYLRPTTDGGRRNPIWSGYRASCRLPWNEHTPVQNDALLMFEGSGPLLPGQNREGRLRPAFPKAWSRLNPGDVIEILEGSRSIGFAVVRPAAVDVHDGD